MLERDWLVVVDFDHWVTSLQVRPFTLTYALDGRVRRYTPTVLVNYSDGSVVVYQVKPRDRLLAEWSELHPRFKAAMRYCGERGWRFRVVTERDIRTAFLSNATFLRGYRNLQPNPVIEATLLQALRALGECRIQALLACAYWAEESRALAIPHLWNLVAARRIGTLLLAPLTMDSYVWEGVE